MELKLGTIPLLCIGTGVALYFTCPTFDSWNTWRKTQPHIDRLLEAEHQIEVKQYYVCTVVTVTTKQRQIVFVGIAGTWHIASAN